VNVSSLEEVNMSPLVQGPEDVAGSEGFTRKIDNGREAGFRSANRAFSASRDSEQIGVLVPGAVAWGYSASGQSRARRHGIAGIYDNGGILESVTYRNQRVLLGSNPTLSAKYNFR
jgi:hypothetical protein